MSRRSPARGFAAVIAHPERAAGAGEPAGVETLRSLLEAGAVAQVNVCSLLGNNGLRVQETAVALLRCGLAYVIASDGHPGTREHTRRARLHPRPARRRLLGAGLAADPGQPPLPAHPRHPARRLRRRRSKPSRSRSTERTRERMRVRGGCARGATRAAAAPQIRPQNATTPRALRWGARGAA